MRPGAGEPASSLRARVSRGLGWKARSQLVLQLSRVLVGIVLAHLLTPEDYGIAAMALVFGALGLVFSDLALGAVIVQRRELSDLDKSTVFWTGATVGGLCSALGVALAGPIAAFYGEPEVEPLIIALSISFVVSALGTVPTALLEREMRFRPLELRVIGGTAAGAGVGVGLALAGFGAWAIVGQQLAASVLGTAFLWLLSPWRPRLAFSGASLRRLGGFTANVFVSRLLFVLRGNTDNLLIGRFIGSAALGVYALAYNVILLPYARLMAPFQQVLYPALAEVQSDRERMASLWVRSTRMVAAIATPSFLGLAIIAPDFVPVVFGAQWVSAVPVIQILAWVGLLQALATLNSPVLQALDRTGALARYTLVSFALSLIGFAVGLRWGIVGVASGFAIAATIFVPIYALITGRALGTPITTLVRGCAGVFQASLIMASLVLGLRLALVAGGVPSAARLGLCVAAGVVSYVAFSRWRARDLIADLHLSGGPGRVRRALAGSGDWS